MCVDHADIAAVIANTADLARVTHADPRCSASCVAVTTAVSHFNQESCLADTYCTLLRFRLH